MIKKIVTASAFAGFILIAGTAIPQASTYKIDTEGAHASINFEVKHIGFSWLTGRFDRFGGSFTFDPAAPEKTKISVEIDATSVNSNHAARDKHLRSDDFLSVEEFAKAKFHSTSVTVTGDKTADVAGDLTFLGVTKPIVIKATYIGGGKDPWGGYREGFSGTTSINMYEFGVKKNLGPDSAMVHFVLHIEGIKTDE